MNLYEMTTAASEMYELLCSGEIDEEVFNDTLQAMGTDEKVENCCKVIRQLEADATAYEKEEKRFKDKKTTAKNGVARLKKSILSFLQAADKKKINAGLFTVSKQKSSAVKILDENLIPDEFFKVSLEPMKSEIKKAIDSGEKVAGAIIVENESVRIK